MLSVKRAAPVEQYTQGSGVLGIPGLPGEIGDVIGWDCIIITIGIIGLPGKTGVDAVEPVVEGLEHGIDTGVAIGVNLRSAENQAIVRKCV